MKLRTFLKATFGLMVISSCISVGALLYYLNTNNRAFVNANTISGSEVINVPEMIISSSGVDAGLQQDDDELVNNVETDRQNSHQVTTVKRSSHTHKELVCFKRYTINDRTVKLCEQVDVYDDVNPYAQ